MPKFRRGTTEPPASEPVSEADPSIRLDKWLWQARFFKSRSLAASAIEDGPMRLNGQPINRPSQIVKPGDVLTFAQGSRIRAVRMLKRGERRGPAPEASLLYADLDAAKAPESEAPTPEPKPEA